jgi:hypothetical protein
MRKKGGVKENIRISFLFMIKYIGLKTGSILPLNRCNVRVNMRETRT